MTGKDNGLEQKYNGTNKSRSIDGNTHQLSVSMTNPRTQLDNLFKALDVCRPNVRRNIRMNLLTVSSTNIQRNVRIVLEKQV